MRKHYVEEIVKIALLEDAANKDITTTQFIEKNKKATATIIAKEDAIISGIPFAREAFRQMDHEIKFRAKVQETARIKKGSVVATISGKARPILTAERTVLNFLGYLSGIASHTAEYVNQIKRNRAKIYDTRKTTPGLRMLERYAVQSGGGYNHRFDLSDMVMVKDNHLALIDNPKKLADTIKSIRKTSKKIIIVEVDTLSQLKSIVSVKPAIVLLDNMNTNNLKKAVHFIKTLKSKKPLLEASGGITLKNVARVAATGVDRISIGALTHSRCSVDYSLKIKNS